ncbi:MAG: crossover junction endodeoxyribonuclease RuvC [Patescibacteria group bacterium]|jgi:crossover junction endodeoxyribonuclease RuvC
MPKATAKTILALDPGLRDLGYAILRGGSLIESGVLPLRLLPSKQRLPAAVKAIGDWIGQFRPSIVVLEATHPNRVNSLDRLDRLARRVRRMAALKGLTVATYAPQTVRKGLVGHGWANKRQTAEAVAGRLPALRVYLTQDRRWKEAYFQNMFDAVALALHHQATAA